MQYGEKNDIFEWSFYEDDDMLKWFESMKFVMHLGEDMVKFELRECLRLPIVLKRLVGIRFRNCFKKRLKVIKKRQGLLLRIFIDKYSMRLQILFCNQTSSILMKK